MTITDKQLLNKIIDHSPLGVCILNVESGFIELYNKKFIQLYDAASEAHSEQQILGLLNREFEADKMVISKVVREKNSFNGKELRLIPSRNSKKDELVISPLYAPINLDNETVTHVAVWMNESAVENTVTSGPELTLSQSEPIANLLSEIPSGTAILSGENFVFELVNPTYQNLVSGRELTGKPFLEALPEFLGSELEKSIRSVYTEGVSLNFTDDLVPLLNTDTGEPEDRYFNYRLIPRTNDEGSVDGVLIFTSEVTHEIDNKVNLERTSNNLNQIINMLPASVVIIRYDNLIVEMINDANLSYWKKTRDEVVGKPFLEILPDLADQPFAGQLRRVMQTGEIIDVKESPVLFTEPDGTIRETFVDYTYQPLTGLDGKRDGVLVMSFEITDRVLAQRQLEQYADQLSTANDQLSVLLNQLSKSESRFKYVFEKAPVAIGLLRGKEFIVESANRKILEVWGKTDVIVGSRLADALPEIQDQPFLGFLDDVYSTGKPFYANGISAMLKHDGELKEIFFNVVYQPISDTDGNIADILVVATDVTEQVNARKAVESSAKYFKMLADLVPVKISNALPSGEVTFFNRTWLEFAGMNFEDLRDFGYHEMMHPDEIQNFRKGLAEAASECRPHVSELRFKNTEGKYIWHLNIASPVLDEDGNITMWIGSTTDIQSLKEEEQRKNDFISMVSHELKTPLTSINVYLQMLLRKAEKTEDQFLKKAYIQSLKQVRNMTDMINGFLNVSRLESGKLHIDKTEFDLSELVEEMKTDYKIQYSTHTVIFSAKHSMTINADRLKLLQVLNNLVGNAVKYSMTGTTITISFEQCGDRLKVSVKDEGMGIKSENLNKLFERFYRVEQESIIGGFGIGLYLSAEIIEAHDGKIWVESEFGKGSTFYFEVPLS
ncbi:PAS domain-containing protein [Chryseobacterium sp. Leaf394]|uniref:PAS domain-containing protein n=1 Tax=Chryseobacterium sp. Leaf394 TaxID=1736361 RepID=UPI0016115B2A|nr:PAS domain-containing protein [Chryseobacterium sp. Leaf394]